MPRKKFAQQIEFPLNRAFTFIESGPVLLISTHHNGKSNLMVIIDGDKIDLRHKLYMRLPMYPS